MNRWILTSAAIDCCAWLLSSEELSQLTTNLIFKLQLQITMQELELVLSSQGELTDENSMTVDEYEAWFETHILSKCSHLIQTSVCL